MKILVCGPEFSKSPFLYYYHILSGKLLSFAHCWLVCSVLQRLASTWEDAKPVQTSESADNFSDTNRITLYFPHGEKKKKR